MADVIGTDEGWEQVQQHLNARPRAKAPDDQAAPDGTLREAAFQREERFIVVKRKHLTNEQEVALRRFLRHQRIETVDCVVVERDWPEYETVWRMIEDRVSGTADARLQEASALLTKAEQTFRHYGDIHAAKPDAVKAERNYALANELRAFIERETSGE